MTQSIKVKKGTHDLRFETKRFLAKLDAYLKDPGDSYASLTHAAVRRASLDLWRELARWRGETRMEDK